MKKEVIAIFDIGKTNKKILLFDNLLNIVYQEEKRYPEITDDDGFACDDIETFKEWIFSTLERILNNEEFEVKFINFTTYGASLMYVDENGNNLTPIYNYLKPMPKGIVEEIYSKYGGVDEFSRKTASPALGMLNSGLQILWLKKQKPDIYAKVKDIMHFPQYLSFLLTNKVYSEYTSIGCHTAMWDFDNMTYHQWLKDEDIDLPFPSDNNSTEKVELYGKNVEVGIGIHDSSASLVPYLAGSKEPFLLISTGTWSISMNPFNKDTLTAEELEKDCLCFLSVNKEQVKSSRLMMGQIHEVNAKILAKHFDVPENQFTKVITNEELIKQIHSKQDKVFFKNGLNDDLSDLSVDLSQFDSYDKAYHQLMFDLTRLGVDSVKLALAKEDKIKRIYISGGFARNEIYVRLIAGYFNDKEIYTSEVENATAIGAALVIWDKYSDANSLNLDLGLKKWEPFNL